MSLAFEFEGDLWPNLYFYVASAQLKILIDETLWSAVIGEEISQENLCQSLPGADMLLRRNVMTRNDITRIDYSQ